MASWFSSQYWDYASGCERVSTMPTLPSAPPIAWDVLQWDSGGMLLRRHWSIVAWPGLLSGERSLGNALPGSPPTLWCYATCCEATRISQHDVCRTTHESRLKAQGACRYCSP